MGRRLQSPAGFRARIRWPDISDRSRLNLAWLAAALILVLGVLLGARAETGYREQAARAAAVQGDILAASVAAALAFDDRAAMLEYVEALGANRDVALAAVYGPSGELLVSYARDGRRRPPGRTGALGAVHHGGAVQVTTPVVEEGARLGAVYLETQPEPLVVIMGRHSGLALLSAMGFLMLGVIARAGAQLQRRARQLGEANERLQVEIRERVRAEEALRQSQKMEALGQLTGGIAHDFNNLLQVVQGAFELIGRKPQETARVAAWAANGLQAAERGASLTRQLLAFSRAQKLVLQPFAVDHLIDEMRELLTRTLGSAVSLEFRLADGGVTILSDRTQLELAVLNLVINARDAMPAGGRLTIATRARDIGPGDPLLEPDTYVELSVSDTGSGMPPDIAERAFDPFFTTKDVGKGTGLGLSQVYGVARQAGGLARIDSTPGQGTTVSLLLRRSTADAPALAGAATTAATAAAPGPDTTILIVDDDPDVRLLVHDALELSGYRVLAADGGPAALALLDQTQRAETRPHLVLIDYAMPGMNGAEAAAQIRQRHPDLPIVFASGYADTAAVETAVGGQPVILRKPFDLADLARTVAEALSPAAPAASPAPADREATTRPT
ncbi:response regulator [Phenylobacterium sp.]|uniref:response regulator n=1 Tax=Phenylobacterium sp. TaxID=1871053 RepID=UPI0037850117